MHRCIVYVAGVPGLNPGTSTGGNSAPPNGTDPTANLPPPQTSPIPPLDPAPKINFTAPGTPDPATGTSTPIVDPASALNGTTSAPGNGTAGGSAGASVIPKVPAPADRTNPPSFNIAEDIDLLAFPNGGSLACPSLQSIRSHCYSLGVKAGNYGAEQQCLCSPDSAYQVTQCFAQVSSGHRTVDNGN